MFSYLYGASSDPLKPYTMGGIFDDAVKQTPDREYLVSKHENKRYTYAAMELEVSENNIFFDFIERDFVLHKPPLLCANDVRHEKFVHAML